MKEEQAKTRYSLIDALRAVAIINMIAYHLCYNIFTVFEVWPEFYLSPPIIVWESFICFSFIIISGISVNFSRHGYKHGIIVNLCGLAVTVATVLFLPSQAIWFGVLNLLGCAMLITFALKKELSRINPYISAAIFLILFILCYGIPNGYIGLLSHPLIRLPDALYQFKWLAFLGFPSKDFFSADYFPLIPWIFLYLFGFELWRIIERRDHARFFRFKIPVLDFIGRHSLIIYMAHQPILYGICLLIFNISQR